MKPHIHAQSSAHRFGGNPDDYLPIHNWFDDTKAHFPDNRHRAVKHHTQGIFEAEKVFGITITNSDGKLVSVRDVGEQHVFEDGKPPSLSNSREEISDIRPSGLDPQSEVYLQICDGSSLPTPWIRPEMIYFSD